MGYTRLPHLGTECCKKLVVCVAHHSVVVFVLGEYKFMERTVDSGRDVPPDLGTARGCAPATAARPASHRDLTGRVTENEHDAYLDEASARVWTEGSKARFTFGTLFDSDGLAAEAWKEHEQVFAVNGLRSTTVTWFDFDRTPRRAMRRLSEELDVLLPARYLGE